MRIITKELAVKIADKLGAYYEDDGPHRIAYIEHNGVLVAEFGIRRASEKDKGHDHVPPAIHLGPGKAKKLGQCSVSREDWVKILQDKGLIEKDDDKKGANPSP